MQRSSYINRRTFLRAGAAGIAAGTLSRAANCAESPRLNFIFILIDDMGYGDLGCYGGTTQTPNIDQLAREGIRFTDYHAGAPICSPSRVAVTTGQCPARWQITSFLASRAANAKRGMANWLDPKAPSLARFLADAGYHTVHSGKWHMGGQRDVGEAPHISAYGFAESLTQFEGLGDRILPEFDTLEWHGSHRNDLGLGSEKLGQGKIMWEKRYRVTERFVDRALEVIDNAQGKPFYINIWPDDVHLPHEAAPERRGDGSGPAMYKGVIEELDVQVGRIARRIREDAALRDSTLLVLASDNGPAGPGSAGGLRGQKGLLYEGGMREPLIVWWPGGIPESKRGTDNDSLLAGMDLPPTLLALAKIPAPAGVRFDGLDRSAAFRGESLEREQPICWVRPPDKPAPDLALRSGPWKLLVNEDGSGLELYNLDDDLAETNNLAPANPELASRLHRQLKAWRQDVTPK